jgi:uncharacterized membrane protein YfcA
MINVSLFIALVVLNLYRGSKVNPSVFGIKMCSNLDWLGISMYIILCLSVTFYSVDTKKREQELKQMYGTLNKSEMEMNTENTIKLVGVSFLGGWISGALGMGGGSVFNPVLLSMGVPPQVASASSMYMIIFSTGASTVTYMINDLLMFSYGFWAGFFCIIGTILGMFLLEKWMRRVQR